MRKTIVGSAHNATPFKSGLDIIRSLLLKGISFERAVKCAEQQVGHLTSKEFEDARNLTKHKPVIYIKDRVEPNR